ncbi:TonB-dependent siderophore receptor [Roseomonas sp. NAR14]|uniref:TonB-dependent siderophore receptor n=1 Tax=Roseomonas acroporae TaxID=2937791 RepID=A0A9X1Y6N9_9PROT|nr:TonB-dependent siderophore receptor [Roseomonas acroporae]MCK8785194.1 TonB-dependent siderophore receptor [Roseomonas acroporae]
MATGPALAQSDPEARPDRAGSGRRPADAPTAPVQLAQAAPAAVPAAAAELPTVTTTGNQLPANTLQRPTGIDRLPGTIQSTPQAITVVPQEILQQQNVTTLDQALRNVPGISATIGEGNGGVNGDQFRIRGFNAMNDIYVDGLRDFGAYTRDAFNIDSVAVLKGPSALTFGPGNVGGAINMNSRSAQLGNFGGMTMTGGLGELARFTGDMNLQVNDTTAVRFNVMGNYNRVVGRDVTDSGRFGFAGSVAFGLGTDLTWTLDYFHQTTRATPDYGIPLAARPGTTVARPVTDFGVPRSMFYGLNTDRDNTDVDRGTSRIRWRANDWLTLNNDTRVAYARRDFAASPATCASTAPTNCVAYLFDNNPRTVPTATIGGGPPIFSQNTAGVQNITTATARFATGPIRHELVAGLDVSHQNDSRDNLSVSPTRGFQNLFDPSHDGSVYTDLAGTGATASRRISQGAVGAFLMERMYVLPTLSLIGGFRWNNFRTDYDTFGPGFARTSINSNVDVIDPRAGLVWEPTPNQTYYFSYGTTSQTPGQFIASLPATFTLANSQLAPERATIYEVGAKLGFFDGQLGVSGSLFRIEKSNAIQTDPFTGVITSSGDQQRVQGFELGITGRPTPEWSMLATYAYLDSQTTSSTTAANVNQRVPYVPLNSVSFWNTYDFMRNTPYNVTAGVGVIYRSSLWLNAANTAQVGDTISLDAVLTHKINDTWRVQMNGYNLTNRLNYDGVFGNRIVPSAGRTVTFTLAATF